MYLAIRYLCWWRDAWVKAQHKSRSPGSIRHSEWRAIRVVDSSYTTRMQFTARRLLSLTDLTSLNESDDERAIQKLLKLASTEVGKVAAVCCWPRFIPVA